MTDYENDYPDPTESPDFEPGDEIPCNTSASPTFYAIVEARMGRRSFLAGGVGTAVTAVFGAAMAGREAEAAANPLLGFDPVPVAEADTIVVPKGYTARVLVPWGTPITGSMPAFHHANTGDEQGMQIGQHHDGMHFFPIDGSSADGLLVMNHEYIEPRYLHAARYAGQPLRSWEVVSSDGVRDADEVLKEINAHGVSITRVRRDSDGIWGVVADPRNRRITGLTPVEIGGPVRGSHHVVTRYSPDGTRSRGTISNCAHGVTPWGTYLTCEENWSGYFANNDQEDQKPNLPREHARYGVRTGTNARYDWHRVEGGADAFVRFDASRTGVSPAEDYRNEPNTFGWVVEINPQDPGSTPVKRTALGRFAHEGVVFAPVAPGRPIVAYAGDDARFEYIYKFVSRQPFDPATADGRLLDEGTLYVAKFNPDGTGEWLALAPGRNGLTPANGFADLADILVNTRLAADLVGATKMDRPEWGAVDPNSGEVYFTLTNNTRRTQDQVHPANPRARNQFGQIIRWTEAGNDHAADRFEWDLFVIAGGVGTSMDANGYSLDETNLFACPDGLWFDADSRLWIQTDIGEGAQNQGDLAPMGNNAMLAADPRTGEIRRFLTGPIGQEITGVVTTPDQRTMFINVQHPGATASAEDWAAGETRSRWPDGPGTIPRSATVVITKDDGGVIGT